MPNRFWRTGLVFDPAQLFSPGNLLLIDQKLAKWPDLIRTLEASDREKVVPRVALQEGEWVLSTRDSEGGFEYRFDDTTARNWLSLTSFDQGRIDASTRAKWTLDHGAYVPQEYEDCAYESDGTSMRRRRFLALEESSVQLRISDDDFGWQALGLHDGARMVDSHSSLRFELRNGQWEEVENF